MGTSPSFKEIFFFSFSLCYFYSVFDEGETTYTCMYMQECTLSLISSSSELLFSSSSEDWLGPTTVKWFKTSKNTKTKNLWQLKHGMRCIFSLNYIHVHVWFHFWKFQGEGVLTENPRGVRWGNTCMDIPPPPQRKKNIYHIYIPSCSWV